jgi:hypothetical protein
MKNLHFYLDGKSCFLSAKKLLSNCYHLCFGDEYTRKKLGNHIDILLTEQGEIAREFPPADINEIIAPPADPERYRLVKDIWNTVKHQVLPEHCLAQ